MSKKLRTFGKNKSLDNENRELEQLGEISNNQNDYWILNLWMCNSIITHQCLCRENRLSCSFDIVYEEQPDHVLSFLLILDFENGDILLLVI